MQQITNPVSIKRIYEFQDATGDVSEFVFLLDKNGETSAVKMSIDTLTNLILNPHLAEFAHDDIQHDNRADLDNVSGLNTGDQVADGITITGTGTALDPFTASNIKDYILDNTLYTSAPASTSTITTLQNLTSSIKKGMGLKYKFVGDANYYYAIVRDITSNLITIGGVSLSANIEELYYLDKNRTVITTIRLDNDTFSQISSNIQNLYENIPVKLLTGKLVFFETWQLTDDTGVTKAKLKLMNGANHIYLTDADGITLTGDATYNNSGVGISSAYYSFSFNDELRLDVVQPGSNKDTVKPLLTFYQILD